MTSSTHTHTSPHEDESYCHDSIGVFALVAMCPGLVGRLLACDTMGFVVLFSLCGTEDLTVDKTWQFVFVFVRMEIIKTPRKSRNFKRGLCSVLCPLPTPHLKLSVGALDRYPWKPYLVFSCLFSSLFSILTYCCMQSFVLWYVLVLHDRQQGKKKHSCRSDFPEASHRSERSCLTSDP